MRLEALSEVRRRVVWQRGSKISEESSAFSVRVNSFHLLIQQFSLTVSIIETHSGFLYNERLELIMEYAFVIFVTVEFYTMNLSLLQNWVGYSKLFHIFLWETWVSNHKLRQQEIVSKATVLESKHYCRTSLLWNLYAFTSGNFAAYYRSLT